MSSVSENSPFYRDADVDLGQISYEKEGAGEQGYVFETRSGQVCVDECCGTDRRGDRAAYSEGGGPASMDS